MSDSTADRETHLKRVLDRLFALSDELAQLRPESSGARYAEALRTVHHLQQEHKRLTGVYPVLPPYDGRHVTEPGG